MSETISLPDLVIPDAGDKSERYALFVKSNGEPIFTLVFEHEEGKTICKVTPMHLNGSEAETMVTEVSWA